MTAAVKANNRFIFAKFIIYASLIGFSLITFIPFTLSIIVSFSNEKSIALHGYQFIPDQLSLAAYKLIFADNMIFNAYKITILVTLIGTFISLMICSMLGYMMSVQKVRYRNVIALIIFIPMIFSAGLLPWYLVVTNILHLKNTIWALILPMLVNPFNIFLLRNFFKTISPALAESAEIDGAGPWYIFTNIILRLSSPILATIGLFVALGYWNDYTMSLWFIDNRQLYSLQFLLYRINSLITFLQQHSQAGTSNASLPSETVEMATFILAIGPIIFAYPYVQKYFVKGIMIGAVKG